MLAFLWGALNPVRLRQVGPPAEVCVRVPLSVRRRKFGVRRRDGRHLRHRRRLESAPLFLMSRCYERRRGWLSAEVADRA